MKEVFAWIYRLICFAVAGLILLGPRLWPPGFSKVPVVQDANSAAGLSAIVRSARWNG